MITITDAQRNSMQISEDVIVLVRLYYGLGGASDYIAVSSDALPPAWTEEEYRPMLTTTPPNTTAGSQYGTYKIETSNINLVLSNGLILGRRLSDLIYDATKGTGASVGFEKRDYEIRLFTEGATKWSDCMQFSKGKIFDFTHTDKQVVFVLQDQTQVNNIKIPQNVISTADSVVGAVPEGSINEAKPDVYGDLRSYQNSYAEGARASASTDWNPQREFKATKMVNLGAGYWFVADHVCKTPDGDALDTIWAWDSSLQRTVELVTWAVFQNTSAGMIIQRGDDFFWDYRLAKEIDGLDPAEWTNVANMVDNDITTLATATIASGTPASITKTAEVAWPENDIDTTLISGIKIIADYTRAALATGNFRLFAWTATNIFTASGSDGSFFRSASTPTINTTNLEFSAIIFERTIGTTEGATSIGALYMQVLYTNLDVLQLYYGGRGRTDDGLAGGTVLEDSADIIKSVAEDVIGWDSVDDAAITAAKVANDVDFAFGLTKQQDANKVLEAMGLQARTSIWGKPDGTLTVNVIDRTYTSSVAVINWKDALETPKEYLTPLPDVVTKSFVDYSFYRNGLASSTPAVEDTTARTKHSLTEAQSLERWPADKIGDSASAVNHNTAKLREFENRHIGIDFKGGRKYVPLDVGDTIEWQNVPHKIAGIDIEVNTNNAATSGRTFYKYFRVHKILSRTPESIKLQLIQRHDLTA